MDIAAVIEGRGVSNDGLDEITFMSSVRKSTIRTRTQNFAILPENSHKLCATIIIIIVVDGHRRGDINDIPAAHSLDRTCTTVDVVVGGSCTLLYCILYCTLSTERSDSIPDVMVVCKIYYYYCCCL